MTTIDQQAPGPQPDPSMERVAGQEYIRRITDLDSPEGVRAQEIEAQIFIEAGYVESAEELAEDYADYKEASHFVVVEKDGNIMGVLRIIDNTSKGLKTLNDAHGGGLTITPEGWEMIEQTDPTKIAEIGTIGVDKPYRGIGSGRALVKLYGAIIAHCEENGVDTLVANMDEDYYQTFKLMFEDTIKEVGPLVEYMGSPVVPLYMKPFDMLDHLRVNHPSFYDQVVESSKSVV